MNNIKTIRLNEYGKSLGTRELGRKIREEILVFLQENNKILFEFTDIKIISSGFADEIFGKLYASLGDVEFRNKIKVNRFDSSEIKDLIMIIINKSISFRKNNPKT